MFSRLLFHFVDFGLAVQFVCIRHRCPHRFGHMGSHGFIQVGRRRIHLDFAFRQTNRSNDGVLERNNIFDDRMTKENRFLNHLLRQLIGASFDHQDSILGSGDNQIELAFFHLFHSRVHYIFLIDITDPYASNRSIERNIGNRQGAGSADHRNDIRCVILVHRNNRRNDVHIIAEPIGKQGPNRSVNHPGTQNSSFGRTAFPFDKAAGNFSYRIHSLFIIHRQREKIDSFTRTCRSSCRHNQRSFPITDQYRSIGLLRVLAGFYDKLAAPQFKLKSLHTPFPPHISFCSFTLQIISYSPAKENVISASRHK